MNPEDPSEFPVAKPVSDGPPHCSRRELLRRAAAATAYAAPFFVSFGVRASEASAYEQAQTFLREAKSLVSLARKAQADRRRDLATEAQTELTEARTAARGATAEQQRSLRSQFRAVGRQIDDLLKDSLA